MMWSFNLLFTKKLFLVCSSRSIDVWRAHQ